MTQANDSPSEITAADNVAENRPTGAGLGEQLRDAREQRSLSLEQVSEALHLDETVITGLEQENFEKLGAPVYIRGHLKAYAQLLGLPVDEIVGNYQAGVPEPVPASTLQQPGIATVTVNPVLWAGGVLVILLGVLLGIYVLLGDEDTVVAEGSVAAPVAVLPVRTAPPAGNAVEMASEVPVPDVRRVVVVPEAVSKPPVPALEADRVAVAAPPADTPVSRPVATMRLGLQFRQESWVEISDANRRLLFGLQREGKHREVIGEPPFNLLIGNARGVDLTINDEPFDVPASHVRGKVARFEITGEEFE